MKRSIWWRGTGLGRVRALREARSDGEKRPVTWPYIRRFLAEVRPMRWHVAAAVLLMPLAAAGSAIVPVATKVLFDGVIPLAAGRQGSLAGRDSALPGLLGRFFEPGSLAVIPAFMAVLALLAGASLAIGFMMRYLMMTAGERLVSRMRHRVHEHIQFLSIRYIEDTQVGGIISRVMSDVGEVRNLLFGGVLNFAVNLVRMLVLLGVLFYLDWWMTLASIVLVPGYVLVFMRFRRKLRPAWRYIREEVSRLTARVAEVFGGARVVKAFVKERRENLIFFSWANDLMRQAMRVHRLHLGMHSSADGVAQMSRVLVLGLGAWRVVEGQISAGDLLAFTGMMWMFFDPMVEAVQINSHLQQAMASVERIYDVLDRKPEVHEAAGALRVGRLQGDVHFENVGFRYNREDPRRILDGISFRVRSGECLAIVGPSGAGKTTLANLLARFYDVETGRVTVDGHDLRDLELAAYRHNLAVVLQESWLFNGTIRENIAYARPGASAADVRRAAELANAAEFIDRLPGGMDEPVGERGVHLSGGQKQRIAIARAILADPRILILDEATSSLDSRAESMIQEALERLMKGRTTLVIAHRLSTITNADRIIVVEAGRLVESGTHSELLAMRGAYYGMFMEQYGKVRFLRRAVDDYATGLAGAVAAVACGRPGEAAT
jgi:subfamily B ATP-binding cassette protein MsbA